MTEIEFYFRASGHADPYLHGNPLQSEYGRWYFHGSGLDLTIGTSDYQASILIRAICAIPETRSGYQYGPLNVVTGIFHSISNCSLQSLKFGLVRIPEQDIKIEKPIAARRVGLNPTINPAMHDALYRFLIMPKEKHHDKTGIAETMAKSGYTPEEINQIWG